MSLFLMTHNYKVTVDNTYLVHVEFDMGKQSEKEDRRPNQRKRSLLVSLEKTMEETTCEASPVSPLTNISNNHV